ncbi:hypothetical protein [Ideonella sp.]|uniref:hypothetical protein n=1 Tax=Ideonella sp. TaxID=1929293 RepID=UPI003BB57C63
MQVVHAPVGEGAEFQALQVQVLRMLDASGTRRPNIEVFMEREFGTIKLSHLTRQQLVRVQRYCEVVEARRGQRKARSNQSQGDLDK